MLLSIKRTGKEKKRKRMVIGWTRVGRKEENKGMKEIQ
jgi:hypothetical protein